MKNAVFCTAPTESQANEVLTRLRNLGVPSSNISVIVPNRAETKNIGLQEDTLRGAKTGGLVGGILGGLVGLTALTLPGLGVFLVAGPLLAAFSGAMAGGMVGGLAGGSGAVHPLGLPEDVSKGIEERLRRGDILVSVHSENPETLDKAVHVFEEAGVRDIYRHDDQAA